MSSGRRSAPCLPGSLVGAALTSLVLVELGWDRVHGNWWTAPGWMPYAMAFSALTLASAGGGRLVPVVVLACRACFRTGRPGASSSWSRSALALYSLATARTPLAWSVPAAIAVLAAAAGDRGAWSAIRRWC